VIDRENVRCGQTEILNFSPSSTYVINKDHKGLKLICIRVCISSYRGVEQCVAIMQTESLTYQHLETNGMLGGCAPGKLGEKMRVWRRRE
jgi:hypothetical protein